MKTKDIMLAYFFQNPTSQLRVRQIERELSLSLPSVIKYTKNLVKEGILKKTIVAGVTTFSADRTSEAYLFAKKLYNLKQLQTLVKYLVLEFNNPTVILFGSYSRGEDVEDSDIDIYMQPVQEQKINLNKLEKHLSRKIHLFLHRDISEIKNTELKNSIVNGITLNGFLEVFK